MAGKVKRYSAKFKFRVVLEMLSGERTLAELARAYDLHPNSLLLWKKAFLERGPAIFEPEARQTSRYERRITELEQLVGKKEVEIALLKNFLRRSD